MINYFLHIRLNPLDNIYKPLTFWIDPESCFPRWCTLRNVQYLCYPTEIMNKYSVQEMLIYLLLES